METSNTDALNFVVVGQARCGASVLQTSISSHPRAVCHGELLHEKEDMRRTWHEAYFGPCEASMLAWWVNGGEMSPELYLTTQIFDHALRHEHAIGVRLAYSQLDRYDLWDYLRERSLEGDFAVIHLRRNPVACLVSKKQAQALTPLNFVSDSLTFEVPCPVTLDAAEVTEFCRRHAASEARISQLYDDRLEICYEELFLNYDEVMREVFSFLEVSQLPDVQPAYARLKNRRMRDRILNYDHVRASVPVDIKAFFDERTLF